jgi:hypothetical protein
MAVPREQVVHFVYHTQQGDYVVFPANVGGADALVEAVKEVSKQPCLL